MGIVSDRLNALCDRCLRAGDRDRSPVAEIAVFADVLSSWQEEELNRIGTAWDRFSIREQTEDLCRGYRLCLSLSEEGELPDAPSLRERAKRAGVFLYADAPVFVNRGYFGLVAEEAGTVMVSFPRHAVLKDVDTGDTLCGKTISVPCPGKKDRLFTLTYLPKTEMRNPATTHLDTLPTLEMLRAINRENRRAVDAVDDCLDSVSLAVEAAADSLRRGGRIIYVGAGTSGRLGVIDAAECPPTFGVSPGTVVGLIAGGEHAMIGAVEGYEDSEEAGRADTEGLHPTGRDLLVGISAAGGAAYVVGAMKAAREAGAKTVSLTCNDDARIMEYADLTIVADTGAEALTGSTRLKAGSAQKMILNLISTGAMVRTGKVCENLMINVRPSNVKLHARCVRIIRELTGADAARAGEELDRADGSIRQAVEAIRKRP